MNWLKENCLKRLEKVEMYQREGCLKSAEMSMAISECCVCSQKITALMTSHPGLADKTDIVTQQKTLMGTVLFPVVQRCSFTLTCPGLNHLQSLPLLVLLLCFVSLTSRQLERCQRPCWNTCSILITHFMCQWSHILHDSYGNKWFTCLSPSFPFYPCICSSLPPL